MRCGQYGQGHINSLYYTYLNDTGSKIPEQLKYRSFLPLPFFIRTIQCCLMQERNGRLEKERLLKVTTPGLAAQLLALHDDVQPDEFNLTTEGCTIGRAALCDVVIYNRKEVSRLHARIEPDGPRFVIRDQNSANGTFVNGVRIRGPHVLQDRDAIGLGVPAPLLRFVDIDPTHVLSPRLTYEDKTMTFHLDEEPLSLTPQQFQLLSHLYQHAGQLCTRESCATAIWGRDYDPGLDAAALDRAVANLRRVLRQVKPDTELIQTRRGLGYVLDI